MEYAHINKVTKIKKQFRMIFASFFVLIVLGEGVLAYLDPGTGSAIGGALWPLIIAFFSAIFAFIVKYFWNPIKKVFSKLNGFAKSK
jgi:uncharacterized membrane protein|tara:strand:- start:430 stop:690 length:261 start_codon:yes stop_codon:yes gene_type:complete